MPRTKDPNPAGRERILDAAEALMQSRGFASTTVDDVCARARLTKGSFFHWFKSKDDLARTLLLRFCEKMSRHFQASVSDVSDPLQRVYGLINAVADAAHESDLARGCLLGEFTMELCDCDTGMRKLCCSCFEDWASTIERELEAAKKVYAPRAKWNPESVARHFVAVTEGALLLAKAEGDGHPVSESMGHFRSYVESLFKA